MPAPARLALALALCATVAAPAAADDTREIGHVNTAITNLGLTRSHRVVVERFDDPEVGIAWPAGVELLYSERDRTAPRLAEIADELPFEA